MDVDVYVDCPGFAAAARRESELRSIPFLGENEVICGHEVKPMTLRHLLWLDLMRSPFLLKLPVETLCSKPKIENDVTTFLWVVSPLFKAGASTKTKWWQKKSARDKFNKKYSKIVLQDVDVVVSAILQYVEDAFLDASAGASGERTYFSVVASVSAALSKSYNLPVDCWQNGWWSNFARQLSGRPNPLDIPLKIAFQYLRIARCWNNPDAPMENKLSDDCIVKWMALMQIKK